VLDEVVQALKDNKGFRVQVEGHTSSEGADDHNQTLSEQRANAVVDYLVAHASEDRLVSTGFASSIPVDTNATIAVVKTTGASSLLSTSLSSMTEQVT